MRRLLLIVPFALVFSACSGSSGARYDAGTNRTTYESRAVNLGQSVQGSNLGTTRITMRAEGSCAGQACAPETYEVSLNKAGGNNASISYDTVAFETEEGTVTYSNDQGADRSAQFFAVAQGEIIRISLPSDIYASFATAETLTIRLGSSVYRLDRSARAPLRDILRTVDAG